MFPSYVSKLSITLEFISIKFLEFFLTSGISRVSRAPWENKNDGINSPRQSITTVRILEGEGSNMNYHCVNKDESKHLRIKKERYLFSSPKKIL